MVFVCVLFLLVSFFMLWNWLNISRVFFSVLVVIVVMVLLDSSLISGWML